MEVELEDGTERIYEVTERTMYDKDALLRERIWRNTGDETLVLITDGVLEAVGPDGEEFGAEQLCEVVRRHIGVSPDELVKHLIDAVSAHCEGKEQQDDVTVVVLRREKRSPL